MKCLSLFSNVGVAEAYLKEIGIDVVIANEIDEKRAKFYKHLYPETDMQCGDITDENVRNNIVDMARRENVELLIATPPCQGMSIAGKMDEFDARNQLIYYAIDVIKRLKPKYIMLENVPRQLKTKIRVAGKIMLIPEYIKNELEQDYHFNDETLIRAMDHGVPQMRERNIYILSRKDTKVLWKFPEKQPIITLREALKDVPSLDPFLREGEEFTMKKFPDYKKKKEAAMKVSKWHFPPTHSWRMVEWILHTPSGCTAFDNKYYYPQKKDGVRVNGHYNHYRRNAWDKPSRTITQNNGVMSSLTCIHPGYVIVDSDDDRERIYSDPRVFSIYELLIISSLPTNWNIPDWAEENFIRSVIGEGIPALLVKKIMLQLINEIKGSEMNER